MLDDIKTKNESSFHKKNFIIGLLALVVLISWGYIIWDKNIRYQKIENIAGNLKNIAISQIDSLRTYLNFTEHRLDSIYAINNSLQGNKLEFSDSISNIRTEAGAILANNDLTNDDLTKVQFLLASLDKYSKNLELDLKKLRGENNTLKKDIGIALNTNKLLKKDIEKKQSQSQTTAQLLNNTILYAIDELEVTASKTKSDGIEKNTEIAKSANKLNVSYKVKKIIADKMPVSDFYIIILDANNELVKDKNQKMGAFETKLEGTKLFTKKITLNNTDEGDKINITIEPEGKLPAGDYKILIYNNGFKIGNHIKNLKKGGIFTS